MLAKGKTEEELTVKALKEKCTEMNYPKAEWQYLNKEKLIDYLKNKEVQA